MKLKKKMFVDEKTAKTILKAMKKDLEKLEKRNEEPEAALGIEKGLTKGIIQEFEAGNYEVDAGTIAYIGTILFNTMPENFEEYQDLVNAQWYLNKFDKNDKHDLKNFDDLRRAFDWAKSEEKGIRLYIEMPDLPEFEVIENAYENLNGKFKYYEGAYNEQLELKNFNKIKIKKYEIMY